MEKNEIRLLMLRAERERKSILQPCLSEMGLALGQGHLRILNHLASRDHLTQKELADICHMDVTTMSRSLDRLEKAGYIERRRDPSCRRSFLICLTPEGMVKAGEAASILDSLDHTFCSGFTEEELTQFADYLRRVCENLESQKNIHPR